MSTWHTVAQSADLDPDFPFGCEIGEQKIALYQCDGEVHALEDVCPHAYALLSQGFVDEGKIECPLHAAQFEIATGKCLTAIGQRDLKKFPVRVVDGSVQVALSDGAS
jgi:nitrite reductase/ring-hydroxylating ferredoxin subunit